MFDEKRLYRPFHPNVASPEVATEQVVPEPQTVSCDMDPLWSPCVAVCVGRQSLRKEAEHRSEGPMPANNNYSTGSQISFQLLLVATEKRAY